jgi:hypothetical protein
VLQLLLKHANWCRVVDLPSRGIAKSCSLISSVEEVKWNFY